MSRAGHHWTSQTGKWSLMDPLSAPRGDHAWVRLANGDVLIAGGFDALGTLASCAIYHFATGLWTPTGAMTTPRWGHTLTLLLDGRVLATGGGTAVDWAVDTAEIYDPLTSVWTALVATMNSVRQSHAAVRLIDGTVLLLGGYINGPPPITETVDIFDPNTSTFTATTPMVRGRAEFAAEMLTNGKVLVAGGDLHPDALSVVIAETYDPDTGVWVDTLPMSVVRFNPSSALLNDGTVFVVGGYASYADTGYLVDFDLATAETYDPATNAWLQTANDLSVARWFFPYSVGVKLPDGSVLIPGGGLTPLPHGSSAVDLYNPTTRTFRTVASLAHPANGQSMCILPNGNVLAAGGFENGVTPIADCERYNF